MTMFFSRSLNICDKCGKLRFTRSYRIYEMKTEITITRTLCQKCKRINGFKNAI